MQRLMQRSATTRWMSAVAPACRPNERHAGSHVLRFRVRVGAGEGLARRRGVGVEDEDDPIDREEEDRLDEAVRRGAEEEEEPAVAGRERSGTSEPVAARGIDDRSRTKSGLGWVP